MYTYVCKDKWHTIKINGTFVKINCWEKFSWLHKIKYEYGKITIQ